MPFRVVTVHWGGPLLLALASGIGFLQLLPVLPAAELLVVGAVFGALLSGALLHVRAVVSGVAGLSILALGVALLASALSGAAWAAWRAELRLAEHLSEAWEGRDLRLQGTILTLPQRGPRGERFEFRVEVVDPPTAEVPHRILLSRATQAAAGSSEDLSSDRAAAGLSDGVGMVPGERWALTVRLRRPHGMSNPGGFDLESWLLQRQLRATGYVRDHPPAQRLGAAAFEPWLFVERLRYTIRERLERSLGDAPARGVVVGLAIGDQSGITDAQWDLFSATGTTHLMRIIGS